MALPPRRGAEMPHSPLWPTRSCFLRWKERTAMVRGFLPWSENFAQAIRPVLKATAPGIRLRLKAWGSPSGVHLRSPWSPIWLQGILADKTSPIKVPHGGLILFKSWGFGPNFYRLSRICLHKYFSWSNYFIGFTKTWLALL